MSTLVVGVSGINAADNPGPGIGVARSLQEDKDLHVEIVGLAYDAMETGIYMDWIVNKSVLMPYPNAEGEAYLARLLQLRETHGLDFVIPSLNVELPFYIQYAETLQQHGIRTFLPTREQFKLRGKDLLEDLARKIGVRLPKTKVVTSPDALIAALEELELPVMVKGIYCRALRANTVAEAARHQHTLVAEWGYPIVVQEIVEGDEINLVGLGDGEGRGLGMVTVKKIMTTSLGKIWTGVTIENGPMRDAAQRFVEEFHWRGPFELECMVKDGELYLIEINPRFPAWSYFATGVGINLPSRLLRKCLGLPVPEKLDYPAGKLFVRYSFELVTDMDVFQKILTRGEA